MIHSTIALFLFFVLASGSTRAARADVPVTVNTLTDEGSNTDGACSLREAIIATNGDTSYHECTTGYGADTITFSVTGTITLTSALPTITDVDGLTITGPTGGITLDGGGLYRIMTQNGGAPLTLQYLTFANASSGHGAAILAYGTTALLKIIGSTFINNQAVTYGGAIRNSATTIIANSTFYGNSAANGGAISNIDGYSLNITNSTFSNNSASSSGGALYQSGAGSIALRNTIVANSTSGGNCSGTITNGDYNLQYQTPTPDQSCGNTLWVGDPKLGPLANNGGLTQTMALLTGSVALDAGNSTVCADYVVNYGAGGMDQRVMPRPTPGVGIYCDIGAYQRGAATAITATAGAPQSTKINSAFATALQAKATDLLGGPLDAVNITFTGPATGAGITSGGTVATNSSGIASFSATANSTVGGPYTVTATSGALAASFSLTNNAYATTTTITNHLPEPPHAGEPITVSFTVTSPDGTPTGTVTVSDGADTCTTTVAAGSCALTIATPGTYTLTASYAGDGAFAASTSTGVSDTVISNTATVPDWLLHLPIIIR